MISYQGKTMAVQRRPGAAAVRAFKKVISECKVKHGSLVALTDAGWEELFPDEKYWAFTHKDFPGGEIRWSLTTREPYWFAYQKV